MDSSDSSEPRRILVVDDEQPILDLLQEGLTSAGFLVDGASTGAQALDLIRENLYDAAILDFALPDMNGLTLHHRIREMDDDLARRTLFISGVAHPDDRMDYFLSDGAGFIPKPFDVWDITSRINKLFES